MIIPLEIGDKVQVMARHGDIFDDNFEGKVRNIHNGFYPIVVVEDDDGNEWEVDSSQCELIEN